MSLYNFQFLEVQGKEAFVTFEDNTITRLKFLFSDRDDAVSK